RGALDIREGGGGRGPRRRCGDEAEKHLGDDRECSFGAADQREQVAGRGVATLAETQDRPVSQDGGESLDVVRGDAIPQRVRTRRIACDVATDGAGGAG